MASINSPQITNAIRTDVPAINAILKALAKADPSLLSDIENGTKRFYEGTSGWEFQELIGGTWTTHTKFNIDAQSVDGYNSSIDAVANTIVVRDANGKLKGNLTGKADTAGTADNLASTLAVNAGGTGATKAEDARTNLGVPPTNHASTTTTYGVSSATQYGHPMASSTTPKADGTAAVGSETSKFARGDHVHPQLVASASVRGDVILSDSASASQTAATGHAASPKAVATAVATVDSKFGNYLPLSGGTMTGELNFNCTRVINRTVNNNYLQINGGTSWENGASINLEGKDNGGGLTLYAYNGTNRTCLAVEASGLYWNDKNVITSEGGTMTGNLRGNHVNDISGFASIELIPSSNAGHGGFIDFHYNGSTEDYTSRIIDVGNHVLRLVASNGVQVNGSAVLTSASGLLLNSSNVQVFYVGTKATWTAPSGGTWTYLICGEYNAQNIYGTVAGGTAVTWPNSGHPAQGIAFRVG